MNLTNLKKFENIINFNFKNKQNLIDALTHPSYQKLSNINKLSSRNYFERLEFLGDRVLGLIVSFLIYEKFNNLNEGDLSKKLSFLVKKEFLQKIAIEIKIDKYLNYSFKKNSNTINFSILADSVESLIGSIYIDSGYESCVEFIKYFWGPYLDIEGSNKKDPKTELQEISQNKKKSLPIYKVVKKEGSSHLPLFTVSLNVLSLRAIIASGKSIRDAEKNAAFIALNELDNEK